MIRSNVVYKHRVSTDLEKSGKFGILKGSGNFGKMPKVGEIFVKLNFFSPIKFIKVREFWDLVREKSRSVLSPVL